MRVERLLVLVGLVLLGLVPMPAYAQQISACYRDQCYPSLSEAEEALRADQEWGRFFRRKGARVVQTITSAVTTEIVYDLPDVSPARFTGDAYMMSGWGANTGCVPSAYKEAWCADEEELIRLFQTYWRTELHRNGCQLLNERVSGSHAQPFSSVSSAYTTKSGNPGELSFLNDQSAQKKWSYEVLCPGWEQPSPREHPIYKMTGFICPIGFFARDGWSPNFLPPDKSADAVVEWPYLCRSRETRQIRVTTRQVCSTATANPCHPATGDKSRAEQDFVFAGTPFVRHYHSLGQFKGAQGSAPGWTHSLEERLLPHSGGMGLLTAQGHYEGFAPTATSGVYRSQLTPGRLLSRRQDGAYELAVPSGELKVFAADGRLLSIQRPDAPEQTVELRYEGARLVAAIDPHGRALTFGYSSGLLARIDLPDGKAVSYEYDEDSNLVAVRYPDNGMRRYHYHEPGLALERQRHMLTGITDESGIRYASFAYDASDRVVSSRLHAAGGYAAAVTLSYSSDESAVLVTENGGSVRYTIQPGPYRRITGVQDGSGVVSTIYRSDGRVASQISATGVVTEYEYDDQHLTAEVHAKGTAQARRTTYGRDSLGRITRTETWAAAGTDWRLGRLELASYDQAGRVVASCQLDPQMAPSDYVCGSSTNAPTGVRQRLIAYCEQSDIDAGTCPLVGLIKSIDGPRTDVSDVTTYTYYPSDHPDCASTPTTCPYRKGDLWKVTNALGHVTEALRYDGAGRVLSVKDANGVVTNFEYHPRGWLTARKVRGANDASETDDAITRIEYWPTGLVKKVTQPDGSFTAYAYDAAHRLTDISDNLGNKIHYTLDNAGNRIKEETLDADGQLLRTLSRVYNQLGQLQTAKDAYERPTGFTYDANGNLDKATDAKGVVTDNDYDPLNRLVRTLQDVAGIKAETKFEYDALDNLTRVIDPKGLVTTYTYNGLGDLTQLASPDTGTTTYTYDGAGNRKTQTDARGVTSTYHYDALNRLTAITYADSTHDVTYHYDTPSSACDGDERFHAGRLARMFDASGSTAYCYDSFGNLTRKVQTTNGRAFTTRYGHDLAGKPLWMIYPSGLRVDYVYNVNGQASGIAVTRPGAAREVLLSSVTYYPFGPVSELRYGDGRALRRTLDRNYQPGIVQDVGPDGLSLGFEFDEVGNLAVLRTGDQTEPPLRRFGYDALGRLTESKDGATDALLHAYGYDATGNRTSKMAGGAATAYTYPATSHRLSRVGSINRWYDATGNTTSIGGTAREFVYDATNRLSQTKANGVATMNYRYNGKGERVRRWVGTTHTYSVYDEAGRWLGDYDTNGARIQEVIWLDDLPVGLIAKDETAANDRLYYLQPDHLGSPRVVIDPIREKAVWTWPLTGEAFGTEAPNQDPDADGIAFVFDMRFPGQRYDAASGLNYNYFRDYEPGGGRYVQSDPIGLNGGISTYGYVGARPLMFSDPLGLEGSGPWWNPGALHQQGVRHAQSISGVYQDYRSRRAWGHQQFPGERNSFERHCTVSCILSKKYGVGFTRGMGVLNEYQGFYMHDLWDLPGRYRGDRPWAFQTDDLAANEIGFKCANNQQCAPANSDSNSVVQECTKCCTLGVMYGY